MAVRPVVEIMFGAALPSRRPMDGLVNQMSKYWFLTQEEISVPAATVVGAGGRFGAIHSRCPWTATGSAKALLRASIDDDTR